MRKLSPCGVEVAWRRCAESVCLVEALAVPSFLSKVSYPNSSSILKIDILLQKNECPSKQRCVHWSSPGCLCLISPTLICPLFSERNHLGIFCVPQFHIESPFAWKYYLDSSSGPLSESSIQDSHKVRKYQDDREVVNLWYHEFSESSFCPNTSVNVLCRCVLCKIDWHDS